MVIPPIAAQYLPKYLAGLSRKAPGPGVWQAGILVRNEHTGELTRLSLGNTGREESRDISVYPMPPSLSSLDAWIAAGHQRNAHVYSNDLSFSPTQNTVILKNSSPQTVKANVAYRIEKSLPDNHLLKIWNQTSGTWLSNTPESIDLAPGQQAELVALADSRPNLFAFERKMSAPPLMKVSRLLHEVTFSAAAPYPVAFRISVFNPKGRQVGSFTGNQRLVLSSSHIGAAGAYVAVVTYQSPARIQGKQEIFKILVY